MLATPVHAPGHRLCVGVATLLALEPIGFEPGWGHGGEAERAAPGLKGRKAVRPYSLAFSRPQMCWLRLTEAATHEEKQGTPWVSLQTCCRLPTASSSMHHRPARPAAAKEGGASPHQPLHPVAR